MEYDDKLIESLKCQAQRLRRESSAWALGWPDI